MLVAGTAEDGALRATIIGDLADIDDAELADLIRERNERAAASALTVGIYTPMTISVECAAASTALNVPALSVAEGASTEQARAVVVRAAQLSAEVKEPVYVRFRAE